MIRDISRFSGGQYDVLIIGGGINGAAIAYLAARNGLKTALLEKDDFASGTSSKSTKLLHGGLRYLENFEFGLVREALKERHIQLRNAPHLVKPLRFIIPVYKTDQRSFWLMKTGVALYDVLSGKYGITPYRSLSVDEVIHFVPGIQKEGLCGGVIYSDAQMDDARVCLENVLMADQGGAHVANHVEVKSFIKENGKAVGVVVRDELSQHTFKVQANHIICAAGPWTNVFMSKDATQSPQKIRMTKGVHIVYKGQVSPHALFLPIRKDRRIFFVIPWKGNSLIGTTDTDFKGNPDDVRVKSEDVEYLMDALKKKFPEKVFDEGNIINTFAGLRPLVHAKGQPSKISRKHAIEKSYSGVIYVMGGKYTTYRKIAEEAIQFVKPKSDCVFMEQDYPLYGSGVVKDDIKKVAKEYGVDVKVIRYLVNFYGTRYKDVLALVKGDSSLKKPLCSCSPVIRAQVMYSFKTEMACIEKDVVLRRLSLQFNECKTKNCQQEIRKMLVKW